MKVAKKYLEEQLANKEFKHSYLEEKVKLDIEYKLEGLKEEIKAHKSVADLIKKIDSIEKYVMSV